LKPAIVPFSIDSTVTWSLSALCEPGLSEIEGGIQPTVAAWVKPRCVPGGMSRLAPVVTAGADDWAGADACARA
jgi:hypothetical protein